MASTSSSNESCLPPETVEELRRLLWGGDVKFDVFRRWTQGFVFSEDEPTALLQLEGGPCAVIASVQAYLLKNLMFTHKKEDWKQISDAERQNLLLSSLEDIFLQVSEGGELVIVFHKPNTDSNSEAEGNQKETQTDDTGDDGERSPKKRCLSHEHFYEGLRCIRCHSHEEFHKWMSESLQYFQEEYGVLLVLCSLVLIKGIDQLKNEVEDSSEPLIDATYGHGSQSLINLLMTGKAVTNVWDNDKVVSGMTLRGITRQSTIGFLTQLEHLRYCEVGWYLKNPEYPIWILGSETHLTVLFSKEAALVGKETPEAAARRLFGNFDTEGSGFIAVPQLGDLMQALDLVSEPEYVKIMADKLDPEQLGIITLNSFMEEFFPSEPQPEAVHSFTLFHYNGLQRSCHGGKVAYQEASALIMEMPELQIITDSSPMKTCLMTKWPTIELTWKSGHIPSLN